MDVTWLAEIAPQQRRDNNIIGGDSDDQSLIVALSRNKQRVELLAQPTD